jgi:cbb3-type cytochrome oxidase maturation protein
MFPSSLAVIAAGLLLAALALAAFVWAWRVGAFTRLDEQAAVVLDDQDLRLARPWETPEQQDARARAYGSPVAARPSEWGGAR